MSNLIMYSNVKPLAEQSVKVTLYTTKLPDSKLSYLAVESCDTREEFRSTMHYVSRLSEDPEPTVRVELMEKVPELSQRCIEKSEQLQLSSSLVEEEILPLVMNFLEDITNTARKGTVQNLITFYSISEWVRSNPGHFILKEADPTLNESGF